MEKLKFSESKLDTFCKKITDNPRREFITGLIIYTVLFSVICYGTLIQIIIKTGTIYGVDGVSQYYPLLIDFRNNLIHFIDSLKSGYFSVKMMNYDFMFGSDSFATSTGLFLPLFPVFALTAFLPESCLPLFSACIIILVSYLSGITNILMCRHFKANILWSCLLAPAYVFSGSYFSTLLLNPQFLYMLIIFPVMIVGIDKILKDQSFILFTLSVTFLTLSGWALLVYTLPFVVLYAAVKVFFISKEKYFFRLFKYFFKGVAFTLLGIALAAFIFIPHLHFFFNSIRDFKNTFSVIDMIIPSSKYILDTLYCYKINNQVGICPVLIPVIIFCLRSSNAKHEHKLLVSSALILCALPLIRYGINGFMYDLCRWGFVVSCLFSFIASFYIGDMLKARKIEVIITIFSIAIFLIAFPLGFEYIILTIMLLSAFFSSLKPLHNKMAVLIKTAGEKIKKISVKTKKYIALSIIIFLSVSVILFSEIFIMSPDYNISKGLLYILISLIIIYCLSFVSKKSVSNKLIGIAGAFLFTASTIIYLVTWRTEFKSMQTAEPDSFYISLSDYNKKKTDSNYFNRFASLEKENANYIYNSEFINTYNNSEETQDFSDSPTQSTVKLNIQSDLGLRYHLPSSEGFYSVMDKNYMSFLERCGMDAASLCSTVDTLGYSNKEVIYALMGVKYLYSDENSAHTYGLTPDNNFHFKDKYLYINSYALPIGVTYNKTVTHDQFNSFNPAELPYAMMNSVYLENDNTVSNDTDTYSRKLNIDLEKKIRENNHNFSDNKITIKDDVRNGFLYLSFSGTEYSSMKEQIATRLHVFVDNKHEFYYPIINKNSNWGWNYPRDDYTLSLGFYEEPIKEIKFFSFFPYEDVSVYYIPEDVYTNGYNKICEETLQNTALETNKLTGDITVSSDKILSINLLYNSGWKAYIDDIVTPIYKANDLFMGIKLTKGSHRIKMVYRTPGLYEGIIVSVLSLFLLIFLQISYSKNASKVLK